MPFLLLPPLHTLARRHAKHGLPLVSADGQPMSDTEHNRTWLALWELYRARNEPRTRILNDMTGEPYGIAIDDPDRYGRPLAREALRALSEWY